jgi:hypothetical protein
MVEVTPMQHAVLMRFLTRALAITFAIVAHAFMLGLGSAPSVTLAFAYIASIICLAAAAALLWRRSNGMTAPDG